MATTGQGTTWGHVSILAGTGSITESGLDMAVDVYGSGLRMRAGTDIGGAMNALETTVATLTARAEAGGIFLLESDGVTVDDVTVTVQRVNADASLTATVDAVQSDLKTNGADGDVVLESTTGDVTLNDGTAADDDAGDAVNANGAGDVLIRALDGSITANADVRSTDGNLSILASMNVSTTVDVDLVTGAGTIDVEGTAGAVTMDDTSTAVSTSGDVRMSRARTRRSALQTGANVSVIAGSAIIDGGETNIDVAAAGLRMRAGTAIATNADAIETTVATLTARAEAGGIFLLESDGVIVDDVTTTVQRVNADASLTATTDAVQSDLKTNGADGDVVLESTTGDVTLNDGTAADDDAGDAVNANGAGDVLIRALDGSITANADVRSTDGNLSILASQSVSLTASVDLVTGAGTIDVDGCDDG